MKKCIPILVALFLAACGDPKTAADLYGEYKADFSLATETLTLNRDGSFLQEVTLKSDGKTTTAKGTWTYDSNGVTTFNNFLLVKTGHGELDPNFPHPSKGIVGLPAQKKFGHISLGIEEDVLYRKVN